MNTPLAQSYISTTVWGQPIVTVKQPINIGDVWQFDYLSMEGEETTDRIVKITDIRKGAAIVAGIDLLRDGAPRSFRSVGVSNAKRLVAGESE